MSAYQIAWAEAQRRRDSLHRWVAIALLILLALLWLVGRGPGAEGCCARPVVVPPAAVAPAPPPPVVATPAPAPVALPFVKIFFELDKFYLPADANATLKPIVDYLNANAGAKAVISGYHDPTGNREANLELAKNRAKSVREDLKATGIPEDRIVLEKPIETTGSGSDPEARRVEVSVRQ